MLYEPVLVREWHTLDKIHNKLAAHLTVERSAHFQVITPWEMT